MCQPHWDELRQAIDDRGLSHLIAQGGERAARNLVDEAQNGLSIKNFDPLMAAHNAIWGNALDLAGLAVMVPNDDGSDRCPYCYILAEAPKHDAAGRFDDWITRAADGAKAQYEALLAVAKADA